MSEVKVESGGTGLPVVLFITFLVLKLTEVIDWSWWWVTAPLWIGAAIGVALMLFAAIIMTISSYTEGRRALKRSTRMRL